MIEEWKTIDDFPDYSVSTYGRIRSDRFEHIMSLNENQYGVVQVGLMRDGVQYHRSVALLVAKAFLARVPGPFDTPINLDGDRHNNRLENLLWRPRWFAIKYNRQFRFPFRNPIQAPIVDVNTGEVSKNSLDVAMRYGLLEEEVVYAILNKHNVWPTYQTFEILENTQLELDID